LASWVGQGVSPHPPVYTRLAPVYQPLAATTETISSLQAALVLAWEAIKGKIDWERV